MDTPKGLQDRAHLYFEVHVTIDPVPEGERMELLNEIAGWHRFKVAELLMRKDGTPNPDNQFMTTRGMTMSDVLERTSRIINDLQTYKFIVRRYKVEDTLIDSRNVDECDFIRRQDENGNFI